MLNCNKNHYLYKCCFSDGLTNASSSYWISSSEYPANFANFNCEVKALKDQIIFAKNKQNYKKQPTNTETPNNIRSVSSSGIWNVQIEYVQIYTGLTEKQIFTLLFIQTNTICSVHKWEASVGSWPHFNLCIQQREPDTWNMTVCTLWQNPSLPLRPLIR